MSQPITVLFYPESPAPDSVVAQLCDRLGYKVSNNPTQRFDVAFKYFDATFFSAAMLDELEPIHDFVINGKSLDISKQAIAQVFRIIFGYDLAVDPTKYEGKIVRKSNINALRDGEILEAPFMAIATEYVYQKFIDSEIAGTDTFIEFIVPICEQKIPFVYQQQRNIAQRFEPENIQVEFKEPNEIFSDSELEKILNFAKNIGLDYGELDILRNKVDEKIYVIDVENTLRSFPDKLNNIQKDAAIELLSRTFLSLVVHRL
ncbi:MAG: hypothetical protein HC799_13650 [Limnothrix sp. RL_2_0]|nr:hypothetical protein [Limnothrix sp. RL_2_0]